MSLNSRIRAGGSSGKAGEEYAIAGLLQRRCACGGGVGLTGECEECRKKKLTGAQGGRALQRAPAGSVREDGNEAKRVPPIVHDVLRSPGQPLDVATRAFFEPRFGHDFSRVRVHTDARAAESARAVHASAYTVGQDVVFGAQQYSPSTGAGGRLLAHELTHAVQQSAAAYGNRDLSIGSPTHWGEQEADRTAQDVLSGGRFPSLHAQGPMLQRDDAIPVDLVPTSPEELKELEKMGIELPTVSFETWRDIGGVGGEGNFAKHALNKPETKTIEDHLKKVGIPSGSPLATPISGTFILHDTSGVVSKSSIEEQAKLGRGLLGKGVSAWVPRDEAATIARPDFFEKRRPSTTEWEKSLEKLVEPGDAKLSDKEKLKTWTKRRDDALRRVWNATSKTARDEARDRALVGLTAEERKKELAGGKVGDEIKAPFENQMKSGSTDKIWTAGAWSIDEICAKKKEEVAADKKSEAEVEAGCATLKPLFAEREKRVGSSVTVEIVQVGVKDPDKGKNTCNPDDPNVKPMPSPPYTDNQYSNLVSLYLRAAFIAGKFPEITTHFVVDKFIGGHCDPRCFDMTKLYGLIAGVLGHGKASSYGVEPKYGRKKDDTVWWDPKICGREATGAGGSAAPPSSKPPEKKEPKKEPKKTPERKLVKKKSKKK